MFHFNWSLITASGNRLSLLRGKGRVTPMRSCDVFLNYCGNQGLTTTLSLKGLTHGQGLYVLFWLDPARKINFFDRWCFPKGVSLLLQLVCFRSLLQILCKFDHTSLDILRINLKQNGNQNNVFTLTTYYRMSWMTLWLWSYPLLFIWFHDPLSRLQRSENWSKIKLLGKLLPFASSLAFAPRPYLSILQSNSTSNQSCWTAEAGNFDWFIRHACANWANHIA